MLPYLGTAKVTEALKNALPLPFPFSKADTVVKFANCSYCSKFTCGDNRLKSTPNFRACEPLCTDALSTTLICRCRFSACCPTCNERPPVSEKTKTINCPFRTVKELEKGRVPNGTAPPKLSKEKLLEPSV